MAFWTAVLLAAAAAAEGAGSCLCLEPDALARKFAAADGDASLDFGTRCAPHGYDVGQTGTSDPWCFVDPCHCQDEIIGETRLFGDMSLYYSYTTCCEMIMSEYECNVVAHCKWRPV